ncbi:MAG TPA: hypothetical protein VKV04_05855 [Verrucomicrobiae bacterium]|nr:hypothetical protein [Verrucomicrobiae bacterium]
MNTIQYVIVCLLSCLLLSCASTPSELQSFRFDGSTEQTTKDSNTEIMKHLSNRGRAEYLAALARIQIYDRDQRRKTDPNARPGPLGRKLDGMTYQQIMDYSRQFPDNVKIVDQP